jgi:hypothetical protein
VISVLYSFGVPSGFTVAVVPSDVLTKSTGQVCVAEQIGGLHSAISQFFGSWQGYLKNPWYPQLVKDKDKTVVKRSAVNTLKLFTVVPNYTYLTGLPDSAAPFRSCDWCFEVVGEYFVVGITQP